ncbi:MAG: class C sortase [Oscillospiraceae bacterium]|nr:class C sortase [Oscillospiraceae bacterium]
MKSKLSTIIILLMFLVGLSVLLYPAISTYINSKHASRVVASYEDTVDNADEERITAYFDSADDYNRRLAADPNAFYIPSRLSGYWQTLDITGTGIMGNIFIDRIKVELPIYHGTDPGVLQIGVGHIEGTALPVGGDGTHCVLSGHRGLPSAKLFTDLDKLEIGDTFVITVLDRELTYRIDQIKTVLPTESADLLPVRGKDYCTLVTCTPYGINTHRLLVRGIREETPEKRPGIRVRNEAFQIDPLIVAPIAAIPMVLVLLIGTFLRGGKKKQ